MTKLSRPLWLLLLHLENKRESQLTCTECWAIFEYLAEALNRAGRRRQLVLAKAKRHLQACPHCQDYYLDMLAQLETGAPD